MFCYIMQDFYSRPEGGFSSDMFFCLHVLLQIFEECQPLFFTPLLKFCEEVLNVPTSVWNQIRRKKSSFASELLILIEPILA